MGRFFPSDVILDGGSGTNTLTVPAPGASGPLSVSSAAVTSSLQTTHYANIQSLHFPGSAVTTGSDLQGANLTVDGTGGSVAFSSSQHLGNLTISDGAQVALSHTSGSVANTLVVTGLSIASGGKLDVGNNALEIGYSQTDPVAAIRSYLASGYANGAWNGTGIVTSSADRAHGLGWADSADQPITGLPTSTLLVRWTRYGDTNLDGSVTSPIRWRWPKTTAARARDGTEAT